MKQLNIGFLTPYSGIYPFYSAHLITGWMLGMGLDPTRQRAVQVMPEFTNAGGPIPTTEAAKKLMFFNQSDVLSGLISYKSLPSLIPVVEAQRRLGFFFDMGELIPDPSRTSADIFFASHQIWQSEYALGRWAQKCFGNAGHLVMPLYESGYHLGLAFQQGALKAGAQELRVSVLPNNPADPGAMDLTEFFAEIERNPPPYVHAIFGGNMGTRFLHAWKESRFHKVIPLTVVETMAYEDILEDVKHLDIEIYSALTWLKEDESKANKLFVKTFESKAQQPANIYGLMGYEAGLVWKELLPYAQQGDWEKVKAQLRINTIRGPRGEKGFHPSNGLGLPVSNIIKLNTTTQKINKIILDQGEGVRHDDAGFQIIHQENVSGWLNPFLCI
ncbi:ABC transporter substrate-binding protein [Chitinophaga sancti]|uniref:ABC transporter substrate-binding protein n=1 Tax=Chitinophaga sancti TaxID=1004 RepID=A0A1K1QNC3_9BACT|nr:ABC transporter substrate-binding protein [Chitinophaga sancti]WQD65090.1 ABC transporter substrate-binding protein [Chitinophaga sancti]WQG89286.1 ABC transporter substrate-binding protein [Chitinophaga sancti]SFW61196.1 amino acid/amide ABC transporter substrate-binding protein, HAAT family [Chitinophaga sancti]